MSFDSVLTVLCRFALVPASSFGDIETDGLGVNKRALYKNVLVEVQRASQSTRNTKTVPKSQVPPIARATAFQVAKPSFFASR